MSNHTPGEYYIKYEGIPEIWAGDIHIADLCEIREEKTAPTEAETLANAELFRAAPEMLELLKETEKTIDNIQSGVLTKQEQQEAAQDIQCDLRAILDKLEAK
jgi:hypothetical protein